MREWDSSLRQLFPGRIQKRTKLRQFDLRPLRQKHISRLLSKRVISAPCMRYTGYGSLQGLVNLQVASHKNLQHVLPPEHRMYWQHLEGLRKQDMQLGNDYKYQPDPFLAKKQREARLQQIETQRLEAEKKKQADAERGIISHEGRDRVWDRSPVAEMGLKTRKMVEQIIRNRYRWSHQHMLKERQSYIVEGLSKIGFRKSHVEEACEYTQDEEEALEWLLIHVPEDDLPARFLPKDYSTGITIIAPTAESLALDFGAERESARNVCSW
jgi:ATP-dependent RNA helicase DHX57